MTPNPIRQEITRLLNQERTLKSPLREALIWATLCAAPPKTVSRLAVQARCNRSTLGRQWAAFAGANHGQLSDLLRLIWSLAQLEKRLLLRGCRLPKPAFSICLSHLGTLPLDVDHARDILRSRHSLCDLMLQDDAILHSFLPRDLARAAHEADDDFKAFKNRVVSLLGTKRVSD
jgi:hypothetical protein